MQIKSNKKSYAQQKIYKCILAFQAHAQRLFYYFGKKINNFHLL